MKENWEIIEQRSAPYEFVTRLYVSLNRRGEIAMNNAAFCAIRAPENVTLLYDAEARTIGVKYPVTKDAHFFAAGRYGREGRMRIIRAGRLLKKFGIEIDRTLVFQNIEVKTYEGQPMLVLDLTQTREW